MKLNSYTHEQLELFKKNPDLLEFIKALRYEIQEAQRPPDQQLIDDVDLQKLLKVSKRTTANYRSQRLLPHYRFGGKIFYKYSDVLDAIELNKIPAIHEQIRIGK